MFTPSHPFACGTPRLTFKLDRRSTVETRQSWVTCHADGSCVLRRDRECRGETSRTTSRFCMHITEDVREDKQDAWQQTHSWRTRWEKGQSQAQQRKGSFKETPALLWLTVSLTKLLHHYTSGLTAIKLKYPDMWLFNSIFWDTNIFTPLSSFSFSPVGLMGHEGNVFIVWKRMSPPAWNTRSNFSNTWHFTGRSLLTNVSNT